MLRDTLQIFGYKCHGVGDEQTGGFCGGNVGNVEIHQARIMGLRFTMSTRRATTGQAQQATPIALARFA